jgi:hypothetical protein
MRRVALLFGVLLAAAPARAAAPDVYAVVVGYNGAQGGLPALRFADDDAVRFSLLLTAFASGDTGRVALLARPDAETRDGLAAAGLTARPAGPPTRTALMAALAQVGRALAARPAGSPPPTFYFVYAGHGLNGRILLEPEAGAEAALTGHELRAAIAELGQAAPGLRSYLFLDACRSQSLFTERGGDGAALGPDLTAEVEALERRSAAAASSIGVLTAAFSGQAAGEVRALGAGYFSHVLASGLAGAADADGDERVTFAELAAFVAYNTERLGAQRPWFSPPAGDLTAPVVDLRGAGARLELSAAPAGRYLVQAANGRPIFAEAVKGDRRPLRLVLPPGHYRVVRGNPREQARAADVELRGGSPVDLAATTWTDVAAAPATLARGDGAESFDASSPAFSSPFTPEAVSTLTAAFDAGREPAAAPGPRDRALGVAATLAPAPLDLGGVEPGVALRYRQRFGRWLVAGADVSFGRSSHVAADSYTLDRFTGALSVGPRWGWAERVELALAVVAGGGPVLRRAAGATTGDRFAPLTGVGASGALRVEGRWWVTLDARLAAQWIDVDGAARRDTSVLGQAGLAWTF